MLLGKTMAPFTLWRRSLVCCEDRNDRNLRTVFCSLAVEIKHRGCSRKVWNCSCSFSDLSQTRSNVIRNEQPIIIDEIPKLFHFRGNCATNFQILPSIESFTLNLDRKMIGPPYPIHISYLRFLALSSIRERRANFSSTGGKESESDDLYFRVDARTVSMFPA